MLYYKCAIMCYNRMLSLPPNHHIHRYLVHEGWQWLYNVKTHKWYSQLTYHRAVLSKVLIKAVINLLPNDNNPTVPLINHTNWRDINWKSDLNLITLQASRRVWAADQKGRFHRNVWSGVPLNKPYLPQYLYNDTRNVAAFRARMRFDRTQLKQARKRHGEPELPDDNCEWCIDGTPRCTDNLEHYLIRCNNEQLVAARKNSVEQYGWFITNDNQPNKTRLNTIIAFTDGSCLNDGRAGAGICVCYPPTQGRVRLVPQRMAVTAPYDNDLKCHINPYLLGDHKTGDTIKHERMSIPHGTNNIGELYAVALAINNITQTINDTTHQHNYIKSDIIIAMDSKYCIGVLSNGHQTNTNSDIINELLKRIQLLSNNGQRRITFSWIKGHSGNAGNDFADNMAGSAAHDADLSLPLPQLPPYIPIINEHKSIPSLPSINDIIGIYPDWYGPMDIKRMLTYTAHYITQLTNVRSI
jgi:ribonuclease HI